MHMDVFGLRDREPAGHIPWMEGVLNYKREWDQTTSLTGNGEAKSPDTSNERRHAQEISLKSGCQSRGWSLQWP